MSLIHDSVCQVLVCVHSSSLTSLKLIGFWLLHKSGYFYNKSGQISVVYTQMWSCTGGGPPHGPLNVDCLQNRRACVWLSCSWRTPVKPKRLSLLKSLIYGPDGPFSGSEALNGEELQLFTCLRLCFLFLKTFFVLIPASLCAVNLCVCVCVRKRGRLRNVHPADSAPEDQWPCRGLVLGPPALRQERASSREKKKKKTSSELLAGGC